jgi:hypothetical protein
VGNNALTIAIINIYYANARGLIVNCRYWLSILREKKVDIAIFVESHFMSDVDINQSWGNYYFNSFSSKRGANGIFIWAKDLDVFEKIKLLWVDHDGYALAFDLSLGNDTCRFIVNYLNPSLSSRAFKWLRLLQSILKFFTSNTIMMGDFNFVEYRDDRSSYKIDDFSKHWKSLFFMENQIDLIDVLRNINLNIHTFHRGNYSARLDRIYVSNFKLNLFSNIKTLSIPRGPRSPLSDHRPISFQLNDNPGHPRKQPVWRFNSDFLFDNNISSFISDQVASYFNGNKNDLFQLWSSIRQWTSYYVNSNLYSNIFESQTFSNMREKVRKKKEAYYHILKENPSPFSSRSIYGLNNKKIYKYYRI